MTIERKCQALKESGARCDSGARWSVQLYIPCPSPGEGIRWIGLKLTTEVCDAHRDNVRPMVLADKEAIALKFIDEGLPEPDFLNMRVEFPPIEGRDIRVIAMCDLQGCPWLAKWRIKLRVGEIGKKEIDLESPTNLVVCDVHKAGLKVEDLPIDREHLFEVLVSQGVPVPDVGRLELDFDPLIDKVPADLLKG